MFKLPVSFVCAGWMRSTSLIAGQSVCSGCGSESISWIRVSLFTNVTRVPAGIVNVFGDTTPPAAIVIVVPPLGEGVGVGVGAGVGVGVGVGAGVGAGAGAGDG